MEEFKKIKLRSGKVICNDYERIVKSSRGSFVEIHPDDMVIELKPKFGDPIPKVLPTPEEAEFTYYWLVPVHKKYKFKVYLQLKTVSYADYKPGYYYIDVKSIWG